MESATRCVDRCRLRRATALAMLGTTVLAPASIASRARRAPTRVGVVAGRPGEFRFSLSARSVPVGTVVFHVRNRGKLRHDFQVCMIPIRIGALTSCTGKRTPLLGPGESAALAVSFRIPGEYAFICTVPGQAAAGMRG